MKSKYRARIVSSILVICLSLTSLIGSTFAWFTDSVKTKTNRIVSGNLDVELYYKTANMGGFADVDDITTEKAHFFVDADGKDILWEPGVVSVCQFSIRNVGNLALNYELITTATDYNTSDNNKKLSSVIKAVIVKVDDTTDLSSREKAIAAGEGKWDLATSAIAAVAATGTLSAAAEGEAYTDETYAAILYWKPTENDNDYNMNNGYQGKEIGIDIDIRLIASQLTEEKDSFDNQYDKDAQIQGEVTSSASLKFDSAHPDTIIGITEGDTSEVLIVPAEATKIAAEAFKDNKNIKELTMPVGVEIGEGAFEGCDNLSKVKLVVPDGETAKIDTEAFACCPSLETVEVDGDVTLGEYCFYCNYDNAWDSVDIVFNGNATVTMAAFASNGTKLGDSTVTFNGDVEFKGPSLSTVFIFSSVREIRFAAGKKIIIPDSIVNDMYLEDVIFEGAPAEGSSIDENAFYGARRYHMNTTDPCMTGVYIGDCTTAQWAALGLPTHFNGEYWDGGDVIEGLPQ